VVEVTSEAFLTQIHEEPTRENNILDVVFCSNPSLVKNSTSVPGISDHSAVVTDLNTKVYFQKQKPRSIYQYAKANWEKVREDLTEMVNDVKALYSDGADVDRMWCTFKEAIKTTVNKHVPSKTIGKKTRIPWLTQETKRLLRKKKRLFRQAKKTKNWANYKFIQKECKKRIRKAEWDHINDTISKGLLNNNSKPFWNYVKSKKNDNIGIAPLKKNGTLFSDPKQKAEILVNQFKSVFTKSDSQQLPPLSTPSHPSVSNISISEEGVLKLLRNIKQNKASGPDQIGNPVLKECAETLAPALCAIFQRSVDSAQLPYDWRTANVACAFKKGDKHLPENYRPISLTSVCCKILEHIVYCHLMDHFEKHGTLTKLNHGFRAGYSCETQLLTTVNDLLKSFDTGNQTDVAILDFSKAFDTVPHAKLLHKLSNYGIKGTTLQWICNFLTKRTMKVIVDGEESQEVTVDSGVPQGTVLGPLLFLVHINDLPSKVKSQVRLFADDCLLYRQIRTFRDHLALQKDLASLEKWADDWGMRFNAKKCNILSVKKKSDFRYQLNQEILQEVTSSPYLGVTLSNDMKWRPHITTVCNKASSTLGFLRRNLRYGPKECRKTAYLALVRSKLEYACIVWDPYLQGDTDKLEMIQHRAARFITGDYRSRQPGSVTAMLNDLGLQSLEDRRQEKRLVFLFRVVEGLVPAIPSADFLIPAKTTKRRIQPTRFPGFVASNIVERHVINNSRGFDIPDSHSAEYKNSFFVKTVVSWNQMNDSQVKVETPEEFRRNINASANPRA
jgi:hypothetical protein